jgi:hypothetical protein
MAYANGIRFWTYKTTDTAATVDTAQYFNGAVEDVQVGDLIWALIDTDGTPQYGFFVVLSNDGTDVDVGDMTQIGGTDTD